MGEEDIVPSIFRNILVRRMRRMLVTLYTNGCRLPLRRRTIPCVLLILLLRCFGIHHIAVRCISSTYTYGLSSCRVRPQRVPLRTTRVSVSPQTALLLGFIACCFISSARRMNTAANSHNRHRQRSHLVQLSVITVNAADCRDRCRHDRTCEKK